MRRRTLRPEGVPDENVWYRTVRYVRVRAYVFNSGLSRRLSDMPNHWFSTIEGLRYHYQV